MSKFHVDISFVVEAKTMDEAVVMSEKVLRNGGSTKLTKSARYQPIASSVPAFVPNFDSNGQPIEH
jgi:hypothetical protein